MPNRIGTIGRFGESAPEHAFKENDFEKSDSRTVQVLMVGANKKVLEIGPGTGHVTKALRQRGCDVTCVEIDAKNVREVRKYSARVIHANIETLDLSMALKAEKFDVILFGDVLEHLKDPSATLSRVRRYLKRSGYVVATVPNVAHASVRLLLLNGNFDPKPAGLIDSTHLHFYTRKTLLELFARSGYSVQMIKEIKLSISAAENLHVDLTEYPLELVQAMESDPEATIYQFAVIARLGRTQVANRRATDQRQIVSKFLIEQDTADPLSLLLSFYHARLDLQSAFPEVKRGEYKRLLRWACTDLADKPRHLLDPYLPWYRTNPISRAEEISNKLQLKDNHITNLEVKMRDLENQLRSINNSLAWKLVSRYRHFSDKWFPFGTRRRSSIERLAGDLTITLDEGLIALFRHIVDQYVLRRTRDKQYQAWLRNNELTRKKLVAMEHDVSRFSYQPKISIIMPVYNTDENWLRLAIESVVHQIYRNWELCIVDDGSAKKAVKKTLEEYSAKDVRIKVRYLKENCGVSVSSNEGLTMANGDFLAFLDHDDELTRDALFQVVDLLNRDQGLDLIYSDEDKIDLNGRRCEPFFKPDWSPDLLLSMNYVAHLMVIRKSLAEKVGGFRRGFEGSQDYDLILRVTELTDRIGHIPKPLYSWRKISSSAAASTTAKSYAHESGKRALLEAMNRRGLKGEVLDAATGAYYRVRYAIKGTPLVSIIIPTKDQVDLLKQCIESIDSKTSYQNYEIIIVDNGSQDHTTQTYFRSIHHRVVKFDEPFNFSKLGNFGATCSKGEFLLFLNNDTEVVDEHWLEAMLEHAQRAEVGMVGGLLLYPNDGSSQRKIQHAGVNIGVGGVAGHAFKYLLADTNNYFNLHRVVRNCSAVTGACAMIRRRVFEEVGGFNEHLKVAFGDIDLCLRVRKKGYPIVYTPYAMLVHHESATRGKLHPFEDERYMIACWEHELVRGDPCYNPNLTLLREDYSLSSNGLVVRPLAILMDIYNVRPDLQKVYPEARKGDYRGLVSWAATSGLAIDAVSAPLRAYAPFYASYSPDACWFG